MRSRIGTAVTTVLVVVAGVTSMPSAAAAATTTASVVPRPDHVVIVVEENHSATQIIGSPDAPYINSLASENATFTQAYAVSHPSQPNYIALLSGSTQGVTDDSCPQSFATPSLGDELIGAGFGFAGYSESQPSAGFLGCGSAALYARKHNPWSDFPAIPTTSNQPLTAFPTDYTTLPAVSFVVPNLQNDMHDGTVAQGDAWLQANLSGYITWAKTHNSLFILTFDEDDNSSANRIATIFAGQRVVPGSYAETISHYNVLRTISDAYGLTPLGASATSSPIIDIWSAPAGDPPPVAAFTWSCQGVTCAFDGTGSTDDTSVANWSWDFGDGSSGTGSTVSHSYAGSATYPVTLRVTDDQGATSAPITQSVPVSAPAGTPFVSDAFARTVNNGLGTADVGGAYSTIGSAANFSVTPGAAALRLGTAGTQLATFLRASTRTDADVLAAVAVDKAPVAAPVYLTLQGRRISSGNEYDAKMLVNADASVTLRVTRVLSGAETALAGPVKLTGIVYSAGMVLNVRLQVTGTSPTTVRARAWVASSAEPTSWQVTGSDATAALQVAGSVGLVGYLGSAATNAPVTVRLSSLIGIPTAAPANQPPAARYTSSCAQLTCSFTGNGPGGSTDPDGTVTGWAWDFGDGASGTGAIVQHAFVLAGTYPVTLTVTDNQGATNAVTQSVTVTAPPVNQPPVAAFTFSGSALNCSFDGTGSSDDKGVASWAWDFGDGSTGIGSTVSHAFAAGANYSVRLTVSDADGATNAVTHTVTVSAPPPTPFVSDTFARTVSNGLGTANVGGPWSTAGSPTLFSVSPGAAALRLNTAGSQLGAYLPAVTRTDADVLVALALDKVPVGGPVYLSVQGRRVSSGNEYDAKLLVYPDASVTLRVTRLVGGAETALAGPIRLAGLVYTAGIVLNVRLQVMGTRPTTVQARAWAASTAEPAGWLASGSDATAALQAAGSVGLTGYLSGTATNAPVTVRLSSLTGKPTAG